MSIFKYGCVVTYDKYNFRLFHIRLMEFKSIRDVLFLRPKGCYKLKEHTMYPSSAKKFYVGELESTPVDGILRFKTRIRNIPNKLFDSLDECAKFCKELYIDEDTYAEQVNATLLVEMNRIDKEYYSKCLDIIFREKYVVFDCYNYIPVYTLYRREPYKRSVIDDHIVGGG